MIFFSVLQTQHDSIKKTDAGLSESKACKQMSSPFPSQEPPSRRLFSQSRAVSMCLRLFFLLFIQQTNRGKRVGKQNKNTKQKSCGEEIQKETTQESSRAIKHSTVCFEEHFQEKSWCKQKPVSYIIIVSTTRCVCLSFKDVLIMSIFLGLDISHVC